MKQPLSDQVMMALQLSGSKVVCTLAASGAIVQREGGGRRRRRGGGGGGGVRTSAGKLGRVHIDLRRW